MWEYKCYLTIYMNVCCNHACDYYSSHTVSYIGCTGWEFNFSVILPFGLGGSLCILWTAYNVLPFWLWFGLTLWKPYPGTFYTGDGVVCDEHGYILIKGSWQLVIYCSSQLLALIPFKDIINVSGHHLSDAGMSQCLSCTRALLRLPVCFKGSFHAGAQHPTT